MILKLKNNPGWSQRHAMENLIPLKNCLLGRLKSITPRLDKIMYERKIATEAKSGKIIEE